MKISIFNEKGGAGKTTTAVALAIHYGLPLVDLDPQATATNWLQQRVGGHPMTDRHGAGWVTDFPRVAARWLKQPDGGSTVAVGWVADFPPGLSLENESILIRSDLIIVPVQPTFPGLATLADTVRFLSVSVNRNLSAKHEENLSASKPIIALLGNDVNGRSSDKKMLLDALEKYQLPILGVFTSRVAHGRAGLEGKSAAEIDKEAAQELAHVVQSIKKLLK